ncbi:hypothetical protein H0H92_003639, partial [Tricholoma furcatifolium]
PPPSTTTTTTNLYIQAYEADIIRGPKATLAAAALEPPSGLGAGQTTGPGSALIQLPNHSYGQKLPSGRGVAAPFPQDLEDAIWDFGNGVEITISAEHGIRRSKPDTVPHGNNDGANSSMIWVDRYDARLLLDPDTALPLSSPTSPAPPSPTNSGWSDLPSDTEDTFFLTPEERDDFQREKKRRRITEMRDARVRARRAEDGVGSDDDEDDKDDAWGGSDEEPTEPQSTLMNLTATHLLSSPNPIQLEARILANHGGDPKFAFLRGRWGRAWALAKAKARAKAKADAEAAKKREGGLGGLVGYGSGDSASASESENENENESSPADVKDGNVRVDVKVDADADERPPLPSSQPQPQAVSASEPASADDSLTDAVKEARRVRAREWAKRRRADGGHGDGSGDV